ncbi:UNKNOWN [Stylonychia lemnae]|uniref:Uncharacterized protein n=1 Tax=Stylonychia lemnae TaxID=5949 RepID=A0A077ZUG6_STYLE|nr:UNKNOWN [Stylonychia lemnae]|eukprot:CDW73517.1 UNKNOWN [Stylonychia lemnae]
MIFGQGDKLHSSTVLQSTPGQYCSANQGQQYPTYDLDPIEVTIGDTVEYQLTLNKIKQCQGQVTSITSIYDEFGLASRTKPNAYITISAISQNSATITVNAADPLIQPGYRQLIITACFPASPSQLCNTETALPLIVWPKQIIKAPMTQPQACKSQKKYPKTLSSYNSYVMYSEADLDKDNGNHVICGRIQNSPYKPQQFNTAGGTYLCLIVFSDINGQIYWGYSIVYLVTSQNSQIRSCKISANKNVYGLFVLTELTYFALVKFDYETGRVYYNSYGSSL